VLEYDFYYNESPEYFYGFQIGVLEVDLKLVMKLRKAQLKASATKNEELKKRADGFRQRIEADWTIDRYEDISSFLDKYKGLSIRSLAKRYIAESEFLPWRGLSD
jgi:hypothetical protein